MKQVEKFLASQNIRNMIEDGFIKSAHTPITPRQLQPASLDLAVAGNCFYESEISIALPGKANFELIKQYAQENHFDYPHLLKKNHVYYFRTNVVLDFEAVNTIGYASPKSSIGRLDVLVRMITDSSPFYDHIPPYYNGEIWIEVIPQSFNILVQSGDCLNQLRFADLVSKPKLRMFGSDVVDNTQIVSIHVKDEDNPIGYTPKDTNAFIDLGAFDIPVYMFWEPVYSEHGKVTIKPYKFYIFSSKEYIMVPNNFCAQLTDYDTTVGEFRLHYAGFFDPGFGVKRATKGVFELRSTCNVPIQLAHGSIAGKLNYFDMIEEPKLIYGDNVGNYDGQKLRLSKMFSTEVKNAQKY